MKRKITEEMERLYRMCHHNFGGMSYADAAKAMGITIRSVYRVLNELRKLAPQLFPILTQEQATILRAWDTEANLTIEEVAISLGLTEDALNSKMAVIRRKLGVTTPRKKTTVRMPSSQMDKLKPDEIVDTF